MGPSMGSGIYFKCVRQRQGLIQIVKATLIAACVAISSPDGVWEDRANAWGMGAATTYGNSQNTRYLIENTGAGVLIADFDRDGRNEVLVLNGARLGEATPPTPYLYRSDDQHRFTEIAKNSGINSAGWAQGACSGDFNNDGWPDLLITYYGVSRLYRNQKGVFTDVTGASGLPVSGVRWGAGCTFFDYDRDGLLDIFISNYVDLTIEQSPLPGSRAECMWKDIAVACGPRGLPKGRNYLYHQVAGGKFVDVSEKAGILKPGTRYGLGVTAADFNNDGWPDIYVACDMTPSLLYENQRNGTFVERALEAGVALDASGREQAGMGIAVGDFDNSGTLDIAKTNFSGDLPSLYLNEDGNFYTDIAAQAGLGKHLLLGWGAAFFDVDADGWLDLMLANGHTYPEVDRAKMGESYRQPTLLYRNMGNRKFADLSATSGTALSQPKASRGLAIGDLNGDGYPEVVLNNRNEAPSVLEHTGTRGTLFRVTLEGTKSNRSAYGARVTIETGKRKQMAELTSGTSFYSQHEDALYFGLGAAARIDKLTVRWPNGLVEARLNVDATKPLDLVEGKR